MASQVIKAVGLTVRILKLMVINNQALLITLLAILLPLSAIAAPELIAFSVEGSVNTPLLEPKDATLLPHQEYVFMINNYHDETVVLHYGEFGQNVSTLFLQGTSHLTQESMILLPHSKIMWHFHTTKEGEYPLMVSNPSLNIPGKSGKIRVGSSPAALTDENTKITPPRITSHRRDFGRD